MRAVAVVRAEHGARGTVEIELVDLATDKALVVSVPRPARDEDLYRALALKIQAVLRATLSEARAELDPGSSLGRLVAESGAAPPAPAPRRRRARRVGARRRLRRRRRSRRRAARSAGWRCGRRGAPRAGLELALGTAALGSASASNGTVDGDGDHRPGPRRRRGCRSRVGRGELLVGPCAEATYVHGVGLQRDDAGPVARATS